MPTPFESAIAGLTEIQQEAVGYAGGPLLVLAGPGSGKTQVLTCRIAQLLDNSKGKNFRVLALTFTNKAADEMKARVGNFVPALEDRANIGTFHSFCAQILRQHGVHMGINPDFAIYSRDDDRQAVLEDALERARQTGQSISDDYIGLLPLIDRLKARLIEPEAAEGVLGQFEKRGAAALAYRLYEEELRRLNALDFNSLIMDAYRLATKYPALAERYRTSHPYWLVDEFQDTNIAQYRLLRALAGTTFRNVFAVADDDQIIYQWNGASYRRIQSFISDFGAETLQLPTNYRCPPLVVEAANRLVAYNAERSASKKPLVAGKTTLKFPVAEQFQVRRFESDQQEADQLAQDIAHLGPSAWNDLAVLGRNRSLLVRMQEALKLVNVPAIIAQRRDDFLSPEFRWLSAALRQIARPLDRRNFIVLAEAFNRFVATTISADQLISEAEATGLGYFASWITAAKSYPLSKHHLAALLAVEALQANPTLARSQADAVIAELEKAASVSDAASDFSEDATAWRELTSDIIRHAGKAATLDQFLQELQLRSKEPSPKPNTVTLTTVHAAKGREFDVVYVVGLAEDVMPSFQSKQKGDKSPEMEEERRNCFVAITRAKEKLILSYATRYRNWAKAPSRFLKEMGLIVPS
ncbi:MAG: ATP-dependent helicase [Reyranella sp.]|nr:ATP-dependent helicase [Reyranella sp.]